MFEKTFTGSPPLTTLNSKMFLVSLSELCNVVF